MVDKARPLVYHRGSWDGTSTYLLVDLQDGYTVAVLSNDENADVGNLAESISALFQNETDPSRTEAESRETGPKSSGQKFREALPGPQR